MASVPREFLDGMAEFAAGLRRWPEWGSWFNVRAGRLVRQIDRARFEQLKRDPQQAVANLLREEGVTIRATEPPHPDQPEDSVSPEEYGVYAAVCRQLDLFLFNRPDTVFEDQTDGDMFEHPLTRRRLELDEAGREYRVVQPGLAEQFSEPFRRWFDRHPEICSFRQLLWEIRPSVVA